MFLRLILIIMVHCCVLKCPNNTSKLKDPQISFHRFPVDEGKKAKWVEAVERPGWKPDNYSRICSKHFQAGDFKTGNTLKPCAVPSIFPPLKTCFENISTGKLSNEPSELNESLKTRLSTTDHNFLNSGSSICKDTEQLQELLEENLIMEKNDLIVGKPSNETPVELNEPLRTRFSNDFLDTDHNYSFDPQMPNCKDLVQLQKLFIENLLKEKNDLISKLERTNDEKNELLEKLNETNSILETFLNEDQIKLIKLRKLNPRNKLHEWTDDTIIRSLKLRFACGAKGYEELLNFNYPLPSERTLQRKIEDLNFSAGIVSDVFTVMKGKVEAMEKEEMKDCVLIMDEMSITPGTDFDKNTKSEIGKVTLPNHDGNEIATKCLVFMLAGITVRWKQIIGFHFTNDSVDGRVFKGIVEEIICRAHQIFLNVLAVISDMGSSNQAMWTSFGIVAGKLENLINYCPHPANPLKKLYFLADVPHLFKNIRSALLNNSYISIPEDIQKEYNLPTNMILAEHIKKLIDVQEDFEIKIAKRLEESSLSLGHYDKMKVSRAMDVIHSDVGSGLELLAENDREDPGLQTTAWFINLVYRWFTIMTSRSNKMAISQFKEDMYTNTITFLKNFMKIMSKVKIGSKGWKPCQSGINLSTQSILDLQSLLLKVKGYKFVLTSRFAQDCLENLFSCARLKQALPTAYQIKCNLKLICVSQFMKTIKNGSYDNDEGFWLPILSEIKKLGKKKGISKTAQAVDEKFEKNDEILTKENESKPISILEQNSIYYVIGYLLKSLKREICSCCLSAVESPVPIYQPYSKLFELRNIKESLVRPNEIIYNYLLECEKKFRVLSLIKNTSATKMINYILKSTRMPQLPDCHNLGKKILNRFILARMKMKVNLQRKKFKKQKKRKGMDSKSIGMRLKVEKIGSKKKAKIENNKEANKEKNEIKSIKGMKRENTNVDLMQNKKSIGMRLRLEKIGSKKKEKIENNEEANKEKHEIKSMKGMKRKNNNVDLMQNKKRKKNGEEMKNVKRMNNKVKVTRNSKGEKRKYMNEDVTPNKRKKNEGEEIKKKS